jgi:hypothetical protein
MRKTIAGLEKAIEGTEKSLSLALAEIYRLNEQMKNIQCRPEIAFSQAGIESQKIAKSLAWMALQLAKAAKPELFKDTPFL